MSDIGSGSGGSGGAAQASPSAQSCARANTHRVGERAARSLVTRSLANSVHPDASGREAPTTGDNVRRQKYNGAQGRRQLAAWRAGAHTRSGAARRVQAPRVPLWLGVLLAPPPPPPLRPAARNGPKSGDALAEGAARWFNLFESLQSGKLACGRSGQLGPINFIRVQVRRFATLKLNCLPLIRLLLLSSRRVSLSLSNCSLWGER